MRIYSFIVLKKYYIEVDLYKKIFKKEDLSGFVHEYVQVMCMDDKLDCQNLEMFKIFSRDQSMYTMKDIDHALSYTFGNMEMKVWQEAKMFSTQEMILLCALSDLLYTAGEKTEAFLILNKLRTYWKDYDADLYGRSTQYLYHLYFIILYHYREENYSPILNICEEAINICKRSQNLYFLSDFLACTGLVYLKKEKREEAVKWLNKGLQIFSILEDNNTQTIKKVISDIENGKDITSKISLFNGLLM